jgi:hypothetical protein
MADGTIVETQGLVHLREQMAHASHGEAGGRLAALIAEDSSGKRRIRRPFGHLPRHDLSPA